MKGLQRKWQASWSIPGLLVLFGGLLAGCTAAGSAAGVQPLYEHPSVNDGEGAVTTQPLSEPEQSMAMALGPGDVFDVKVFQDKELSSTFMVGHDGAINFPLVGRLEVQGLTPNQIAGLITEKLQQGYIRNPVVNVLLKQSNSKKIFVFGQVHKPGTFNFEDNMSIVQAITLAGGFTAIASKDRTNVTRLEGNLERKYTIPISKILDGDRRNFLLQPGDIVYVPESMF